MCTVPHYIVILCSTKLINLNGSICFSDSESFDNGFKVIKYDVAYIGNKNDLNVFFSIALY